MEQLSSRELTDLHSVATAAEGYAIKSRAAFERLLRTYVALQTEHLKITKQRDELVAALEKIVATPHMGQDIYTLSVIETAITALAKAKGGA